MAIAPCGSNAEIATDDGGSSSQQQQRRYERVTSLAAYYTPMLDRERNKRKNWPDKLTFSDAPNQSLEQVEELLKGKWQLLPHCNGAPLTAQAFQSIFPQFTADGVNGRPSFYNYNGTTWTRTNPRVNSMNPEIMGRVSERDKTSSSSMGPINYSVLRAPNSTKRYIIQSRDVSDTQFEIKKIEETNQLVVEWQEERIKCLDGGYLKFILAPLASM